MRRVGVIILAVLVSELVGLEAGPARATHNSCLDPLDGLSPVGVTDCAQVRPGAPIQGCTLNFMFTDPDGNRYMGTAGHCIVEDGVDTTWAPGTGPVARSRGVDIGRYVYAVLRRDRDFALIRLYDNVSASPQVIHFGGPTGLFTDHKLEPEVVHHVGRGIGFGSTVRARTGVAAHSLFREKFYFTGAGVFGDSGSPVITHDGRAVGTLVTLGVHFVGTNGVSRLDYALPFAEAALDTDLELQTAPLASS